jgi:hypothetical protein
MTSLYYDKWRRLNEDEDLYDKMLPSSSASWSCLRNIKLWRMCRIQSSI